MKSPLMKCVGMLAWVLTALCAIHEGLMALGYDLYSYLGLTSNPTLVKALGYTFGVAGLVSLAMFFGALSCRGCGSCKDGSNNCCSKCGSCPCRCGSSNNQNNNGFKK